MNRGAKNTVFLDLFSIPKYQLQMIQALHPEMTGLKEDDIRLITLNHVIINGLYNDLALLVRDKLIVFAEAQSTWSINIILRILLYLSATYRDYIFEQGLNIYGSKKLVIPEPEFYVIYTGSRKINRDIISLRQDFWNNPNAKLDLLVKVINSENKDDIVGQYIIFSRVFDEQVKIHGHKQIAVENTIRICQDSGVLKEYLESRKKEVMNVMKFLFDQDYADEMQRRESEARGKKIGKIEGAMETTVKMCQRLGASVEEAVNMLTHDFGLSAENAAQYVSKLWKTS